jgi:hypothetical protein
MANVLGHQQQGPQIDITSSTALRCPHCGDDTFLPAVKIRKISRLLTGTPKDAILPVDVFLCGACGELCEELLPTELKDLFRKEKEDVQLTPTTESKLIL